MPDGSYALEIVEGGRPVIHLPFLIGASRVSPAAAGSGPGGAAPDTAGGSGSGLDSTKVMPMVRLGDQPGEKVTGLRYENPAERLAFAAPSFAWRFDPAPRSDPENAVVAGRFSPAGAALGVLRVRTRVGVTDLGAWSRELEAAAAGRRALATQPAEIAGRAFLLVRSEEPSARILSAYTLEGDRGYAFELRADPIAYPGLERELRAILAGARFR